MIIDYNQLSDEALRGIAENYVLTHLSEVEQQPAFKTWVEKVLDMIKSGELVVEFSQIDHSVSLKSSDDIRLAGD